jgi:ATP-dependent Clp protease ATP-binding subunit ClpA
MFERFTDRARRTIVLAQEEARTLQHDYIGPEHVLLGLIHEGSGLAARAIQALEIDLEELTEEIKTVAGRGQAQPTGHIPFTPAAKKTLEQALRESQQLGHDYIGTEHLLLGVLHQSEAGAVRELVQRGADLDTVRQKVVELLAVHEGQQPPVLSARKMQRRTAPFAEASGSTSISLQLAMISQRLAVIEERLGIEASPVHTELRQVESEIAEVRSAKESAINEQDFKRAAALRETEKQLLIRQQAAEKAILQDPPHSSPRPPQPS